MNNKARLPLKMTRQLALGGTLALFLVSVAGVLAAPIITVTKTAMLLIDKNSDGKVTPGDRLRYTVRITNTGDISGTNVVFSDTLDPNTTLVSNSLKTSPVAVTDSFSATGNVSISIPALNGLLTNDFGLPAPAVVSASGASVNGGAYTVNSDGSFSYDPPAGYVGADTFTYTVTNANGTDTATVTINVSGKIWFVNNSAGACSSGCNGRLSHPFASLDAFRIVNNGVGTHPGANDSIFIYESSVGYTLPSSLTLMSGQRLIGQDSSSTLQTLTGLTPPAGSASLPGMNNANGVMVNVTSPGNTAISLGENNRLYGFTIGQSTLALSGSSFTALTVSDVSINTSGAAMMLSTGTTDAVFTSVTASGGANSINLNVNGSLQLGSGALSGATSNAFLVSGGNAYVTYTGSINSSSRSVSISNKSGGSVLFNGPVNGTGTGVLVSNNTSTTINFVGGVNLNTGMNNALDIFSNTGGTINVTGATNYLTTTGGTALHVENSTIGASGLTFYSITSNGGNNPGIRLNNTGALGRLTVTGNGGGSNNGSGGTIQSKTVNGVELLTTRDVSLSYMNILNNQRSGIYGDSLTNFALNRSNVQANSTTLDGAEANLRFGTLLGTGTINLSTISGSPYDNIRLTPSSGTLNLTISASTIGPNSATTGNNGITVIGTGTATVNLTVNNNSLITGNRASGLLTSFSDTSVQNITVANSTLSSNNIGVDIGGTSAFNWRFSVTDNTLTNHVKDAISVIADSTLSSTTIEGTISNNIIGNGAANSGSRDQYGIHVSQREAARLNVAVKNNTVRNTDFEGILIRSGDIAGSTGRVDLTLTGNTVYIPDDNSGFPAYPNGIQVRSRRITTLCANIANNTSTGVPIGVGYYLENSDVSSIFNLQGYTGDVAVTLANRGNTGDVDWLGTISSDCSPVVPVGAASSGKILARPNNVIPAIGLGATIITAPAMVNIAAPQSALQQAALSAPAQESAFRYVTPSQPQQPGLAGLIEKSLNGPLTAGSPITVGSFILPPGKSITITFDADVDDPTPPGINQVSNQGRVSGNGFSSVNSNDPTTPAANDPTVTQLDIRADLEISKSVTPASAFPSERITYTIYYTNNGPQPSGNVLISDVIPVFLTNLSIDTDPLITPTGNVSYTWDVNVLQSGQSGVITVSGVVSPNLAVGGRYTNTVTITGTSEISPDNNISAAGIDISVPQINFSSASYANAENAGPALITVTIDPAPGIPVSVNYVTNDGTALSNSDYASLSGTLTFLSGQTTLTLTVPITDDAIYEKDESLNLALSNAVYGVIGTLNQATLTILDNEVTPTVQFDGSPFSAGEADGQAVVTVTLSGPSASSITASVTSSDGSASSQTDYTPVSTVAHFAPLSTVVTFSVAITDDLIYETDETISLTLSNVSNADPGTPAQAALTIVDNEASPAIQFSTQTESVSEAIGGAVVTITLDPASAFTATANVSSTDGTANSISDYAPVSSTVDFAPGVTLVTFTVPITNDAMYEGDEAFILSLTNPISASLGAPIASQVTIVDDDPAPVIQFEGAPYSASESAGSAPVTITLDRVSVFTVTVVLSSTDGTAVAPADYTPISQVVTFVPGELTQTVNLILVNNSLYEPDKTLWLSLSNPTSAITSGTNPAPFTIMNDDPPPTVQFSDSTYRADEASGQVAITVTLNTPSGLLVTVAYTVSEGSATSPSDFLSSAGVLTFTPGQTSQVISVTLVNDAVYEGDETVQLSLGAPVSATLNTPETAALTITDDETQPTAQFSTGLYTVTESDLEAPVTVTLSGPSAITITVDYATADGSAVQPNDYVSAGGTLVFTPGITTRVFAVAIISDSISEPPKALSLTLSDPMNTTLVGVNPATLVIRDDDPYKAFLPIVRFPSEPTVQFTSAVFSASESAGSALISAEINWMYPLTVTVDYTASNGSAVAPDDYSAVSGTLVFTPGVTIQSFVVPIVNNTLYGSDKTVLLSLGEPMTNTTAGSISTATLVIVNDDPAPSVQFSSAAYSMTERTGSALITATLSAPSSITTTVRYTTSNGTAIAPGDYLTATGILAFAPGITSQTFTVTVVTDTLREATESLSIALGDAANATLGPPSSATLYIYDDTAPDLIVQSIVASSDQVTVVIRNIGSASVVDEFWVDVYISPTIVPTHVNQIWSLVGTRGLAWGITSAALPLAPGAAFTLTVNGAYYSAKDSNMGGSIASGTPIYAQADSVNLLTTYGNVLETHELINGPYNNIASLAGPTQTRVVELPWQPTPATTSSGEASRLPARK